MPIAACTLTEQPQRKVRSCNTPRNKDISISHVQQITMDGPGTITWEEFLENAENFVLISDRISDGWELRGNKSIPGEAYLFRSARQFISQDTEIKNSLPLKYEDTEELLEFDLEEDPFVASCTVDKPLVTEHHILWSISYSVPVLYFNGWKSDFPGVNPVSVEEAQRLVPGTILNYSELSQAMHPILATPFLQLHPCLSHELLQIAHKSKNKLVSWLSTVGPAALRLKVDNEYFKLTV